MGRHYELRQPSGPGGDIILSPTRANRWIGYAIGIFFLYLMVGMFVDGLNSLRDSLPIGALLMAFSLGGSFLVAQTLRKLHSWGFLRIDRQRGILEINLRLVSGDAPGRGEAQARRVALGEIQRVDVAPVGYGRGNRYAVVLHLAGPPPDTVAVVEEPERGAAEALSSQLAQAIGCPGPRVLTAEHHSPRDRDPLWLSALQVLLIALLACGALGFLGGFLSAAMDWGERLDAIELPLGDPEGLAVDSAGRIYVGSKAYRRVQRYTAEGRFDRGWAICCYKGTWRIAVGPAGARLQVGSGHPDYALDEQGPARLMGAGEAPYTGEIQAGVERFQASDGALYRLRSMPPAVIRVHPGGEETIVSQGALYLLVTSPLPAWLVVLFSILGLGLTQRLHDRQRSA